MDSKELRVERAKLWDANKALLEAAEGENRKFSPEEQAEWDKRDADIVDFTTRIENVESVEARAKDEFRKVIEAGKDEHEPGTPEARAVEYASAFRSWLQYGPDGMSVEERLAIRPGLSLDGAKVLETRSSDTPEKRAQSVTTTAGGYIIPQGFYDVLTQATKAFGGMRSVSRVFTTDSGNPLPIPMMDDSSNTGELLAINTQAATQDLAFTQSTLGAYKFSSKVVLVPIELLQDSAFSENEWVAGPLGTRIARIQNTKFTLGTATVEPNGVVNGAANAGTAATGSTTSWVWADLLKLKHSVDPSYRNGARWMLHDSGVKALKQVTDSTGRPIWHPGWAINSPDTIDGDPYTVNQDVAVPAASAKSLLYGNFQSYFIRDVLGTFVFRFGERFMEFGQVGFLAFARADGLLVDAGTHPIKYLVAAAS